MSKKLTNKEIANKFNAKIKENNKILSEKFNKVTTEDVQKDFDSFNNDSKIQKLLIELSGLNDNIISHRINVIRDFHNEWVIRRNQIIKELKILGITW